LNSKWGSISEIVTINPENTNSDWNGLMIKYVDISSVGCGEFNTLPISMLYDEAPSRARRVVRKGDILISTVRPNRRSMIQIINPQENMVASTGFALLRPKQTEDSDYIFGIISNKQFTLELEMLAYGAAYPAVSTSDICRPLVYLPESIERNKISKLLAPISELIQSDGSEIIQDIISALFRSWFIDFDPVKAKAEGKLPYGMDAETAALFPNSFEDSELGPIPTGWRILTLDEILNTIIDHRGLTPQKLGGDWAEEGYPAISAKNIKNGMIVKQQNIGYISEELYRKWMKVELKSGDILLTSEAPLGEIYYLSEEEKMVTSQRVFGIRSNPNLMPSIFLRYYLDSHFGQNELHARASGSTVSGIRQSELRKIKIITPPLEIMNYFSNKVKPLITNLYNCNNQLISLEQTRDALLPRLMSGELKVN
jgi:type I restriction enzyme, S subunit